MKTRTLCCFVATATLLLTACGRDKNEPPPPTMPAMTTAPVAASAPNMSYPTENKPAAAASQADAVVGTRAPGAVPAAREANEMPAPGQNNDHSGPLTPASAPSPR